MWIKVIQDLDDGWTAELLWKSDEPVQGGPAEVHVRHDGCGIASCSFAVLRRLDFPAAQEEARRLARRPDQETPNYPALITSRDRIDDTTLALVAAWYIHLAASGEKHPNRVIADELDRSEATIRGWLAAAKRKALMIGTPGRVGGQLTGRGRRLVAESGSTRP